MKRSPSPHLSLPLFLLLTMGLLLQAGPTRAAEVARAQFCTAIENREPTAPLEKVPIDLERIVFFTEVRDAAGQTITHRWLHNGHRLSDVVLQVGGSPWRTWSSKNIWHLGDGTLSVQVLGQEGEVLLERSLPFAGADKEPRPDPSKPTSKP